MLSYCYIKTVTACLQHFHSHADLRLSAFSLTIKYDTFEIPVTTSVHRSNRTPRLLSLREVEMPSSTSMGVPSEANLLDSYKTAASQSTYNPPSASSYIRPSLGSPRGWNPARRVGLFTCGPAKILWFIALIIASLIFSSIWKGHYRSSVGLKLCPNHCWLARLFMMLVSSCNYRLNVLPTSPAPTMVTSTHLTAKILHFSLQSQSTIATLILLIPLPPTSIATHATYHPSICIQLSLHCAPIGEI